MGILKISFTYIYKVSLYCTFPNSSCLFFSTYNHIILFFGVESKPSVPKGPLLRPMSKQFVIQLGVACKSAYYGAALLTICGMEYSCQLRNTSSTSATTTRYYFPCQYFVFTYGTILSILGIGLFAVLFTPSK